MPERGVQVGIAAPSLNESGVMFSTPMTTHRPCSSQRPPRAAAAPGGATPALPSSPRMRLIASARVAGTSRTGREPRRSPCGRGLRTPRIDCTGAPPRPPRSPRGSNFAISVSATWLVSRSSPAAGGVQLDQPGQLRQPGEPTVLVRDVAHVRHAVERSGGARTRCTSRCLDQDDLLVASSKLASSTSPGSTYRPANCSAIARATRSGVRLSPSRSGSSPIARRSSRTGRPPPGRVESSRHREPHRRPALPRVTLQPPCCG